MPQGCCQPQHLLRPPQPRMRRGSQRTRCRSAASGSCLSRSRARWGVDAVGTGREGKEMLGDPGRPSRRWVGCKPRWTLGWPWEGRKHTTLSRPRECLRCILPRFVLASFESGRERLVSRYRTGKDGTLQRDERQPDAGLELERRGVLIMRAHLRPCHISPSLQEVVVVGSKSAVTALGIKAQVGIHKTTEEETRHGSSNKHAGGGLTTRTQRTQAGGVLLRHLCALLARRHLPLCWWLYGPRVAPLDPVTIPRGQNFAVLHTRVSRGSRRGGWWDGIAWILAIPSSSCTVPVIFTEQPLPGSKFRW